MLRRHTIEPGQLLNMLTLLAVLVDQAPPSCWLNDVAPRTVVEVEEGEEVRAARGALSTRGAAGVDNLHMRFMFSTCPTSHWDTSPSNDLASMTVAEVEVGDKGEGGTKRAQHEGSGGGR